LIALSGSLSGCAAWVRLHPEEPATLHVGEVALVEIVQPYSMMGSAGDALLLTGTRNGRNKTVFVYRAVRTGNETLIAAPNDLPSGHCVSCVTQHYFISVVP
jgi:hypothetical protein